MNYLTLFFINNVLYIQSIALINIETTFIFHLWLGNDQVFKNIVTKMVFEVKYF